MLTDYGKFHVSGARCAVLRPRGVEAAVRDWRAALARGAALRVRGSGHGMSGASLPRAGEALMLTRGLDHYRVEASGELTVGAGAIAWDIRDFTADRGWRLPVYNGGWAGPTVGGFVSTGGMGALREPADGPGEPGPPGRDGAGGPGPLVSLSEKYGGIWANVARIAMIDGRGRLHRIRSGDPDFPWIFGSMGQFGLILEIALRLLPQPGKDDGLPPGAAGRVPALNAVDPREADALPPAEGTDWRYWFSSMVPVEEEEDAWAVIGDWYDAHGGRLRPTPGWAGPVRGGERLGYRYLISRKAPTPPLLYPRDEDFVLMGVMADCGGTGTDAAEAALARAERAYIERITRRGWAIYCQAENLTRSVRFEDYWGPERWTRFRELKNRFDPDGRVNPGMVVPDDGGEPMAAGRARKIAAAVRRALEMD